MSAELNTATVSRQRLEPSLRQQVLWKQQTNMPPTANTSSSMEFPDNEDSDSDVSIGWYDNETDDDTDEDEPCDKSKTTPALYKHDVRVSNIISFSQVDLASTVLKTMLETIRENRAAFESRITFLTSEEAHLKACKAEDRRKKVILYQLEKKHDLKWASIYHDDKLKHLQHDERFLAMMRGTEQNVRRMERDLAQVIRHGIKQHIRVKKRLAKFRSVTKKEVEKDRGSWKLWALTRSKTLKPSSG